MQGHRHQQVGLLKQPGPGAHHVPGKQGGVFLAPRVFQAQDETACLAVVKQGSAGPAPWRRGATAGLAQALYAAGKLADERQAATPATWINHEADLAETFGAKLTLCLHRAQAAGAVGR